MSNIEQVEVSSFLRQNYGEYGRYVNIQRVSPGVDGLKSVQRRILIALNNQSRGKLISTVNAIGATIAYHPFGDASIEGVINDMARVGVIESQGDFGAKLLENISAAAGRYTKCGLSAGKADQLFNYIDYVPKVEGEEKIEPMYLPVPVPFALVTGSLCWGLGMLDRIPAFTYDSLLEAFKHDDPSLLQAQYGYIMDKDKSDLHRLWNEGVGRIHLSYQVIRPNKDEIVISGSGEAFTPKLECFKKWQLDGQINVSDESDSNVCIRISRVSGARKVDMDEVYAEAKRVATNFKTYTIRMSLNDKARRVSIKAWLEICLSLYTEAFNKSKDNDIAAINKSIVVFQHLPEIGKLVIAGKSNDEIKAKLNIDEDILGTALKKSINQLRRSSFEAEIDSLREKLKKVEQSTVAQEVAKFKELFANL